LIIVAVTCAATSSDPVLSSDLTNPDSSLFTNSLSYKIKWNHDRQS